MAWNGLPRGRGLRCAALRTTMGLASRPAAIAARPAVPTSSSSAGAPLLPAAGGGQRRRRRGAAGRVRLAPACRMGSACTRSRGLIGPVEPAMRRTSGVERCTGSASSGCACSTVFTCSTARANLSPLYEHDVEMCGEASASRQLHTAFCRLHRPGDPGWKRSLMRGTRVVLRRLLSDGVHVFPHPTSNPPTSSASKRSRMQS